MTDVTERTEVPQPEPAYALADLLGVPVPDLSERGPAAAVALGLPARPGRAGRPRPRRAPRPRHAARPAGPGPPPHVGGRPGQDQRAAALRRPATKRTTRAGGHREAGPQRAADLRDRRRAGPAGRRGRRGRGAGHRLPRRARPARQQARAGAAAGRRPRPRSRAGPGEREIEVSPALLFRFSALIYNAHRIHYDRDYCRDVEGYPGLLTHGPLQALAMAEAARAGRDTGGRTGRVLRLPPGLAAVRRPGPDRGAAPGPDGTRVTAVRDRYGRQTAAGTVPASPRRARADARLASIGTDTAVRPVTRSAGGEDDQARPASFARRTASSASAAIARSSPAGRPAAASAFSASPGARAGPRSQR